MISDYLEKKEQDKKQLLTSLTVITGREDVSKIIVDYLDKKEQNNKQLLAFLAIFTEREDVSKMVTDYLDQLGEDWIDTPIIHKLLAMGIEEGLEKGKQEGLHKGLQQGLLNGLEVFLQQKFGYEGLFFMPQLRTIEDQDILKLFYSKIISVNSAEELQQVFTQTLNHNQDAQGNNGKTAIVQ